jgi:hypothetical protein
MISPLSVLVLESLISYEILIFLLFLSIGFFAIHANMDVMHTVKSFLFVISVAWEVLVII